jgi:hypothetical protein
LALRHFLEGAKTDARVRPPGKLDISINVVTTWQSVDGRQSEPFP